VKIRESSKYKNKGTRNRCSKLAPTIPMSGGGFATGTRTRERDHVGKSYLANVLKGLGWTEETGPAC